MAQRAGVALSRIAKDAPISITRVDGAPAKGYYFKAVERKLDSVDPTEIATSVKGLVGFDTSLTDNGFALSYPIATSEAQRLAFKRPSHDHFMAFANGYDFTAILDGDNDRDLEVLFIDLTPGQVAAKLAPGGVWNAYWTFSYPGGATTVLGDAGDLTPQDVIDKLVKPTTESSKFVNLIGIFRPEGPSPEIAAVLEAQFPKSTIKWVSLDELSHGTAAIMHRESGSFTEYLGADYLSLPLGIELANGKTVTAIVQDCMLPRSETVLFTNSRDNQTTATIKFFTGTMPGGQVTIEGLTPKPKGASRIQIFIEADGEGDTAVTVEEVGATARKVTSIPDIAVGTAEDIKAYDAETTIKQLEKTPDANGVIGELPE